MNTRTTTPTDQPARPARPTHIGSRLAGGAVLAATLGMLAACGSAEETGEVTARDAAPASPSASPATDPVVAASPTPTSTPAPETAVAVVVSGTTVGDSRFGDPRAATVATLTDELGEPDATVGPQRFEQMGGSGPWYQSGGDNLSPAWDYPVFATTCWDGFCVLFGGEDADDLELRGWELATYNRWHETRKDAGVPEPGVALADTGVTLGDSWETLHAAYPDTETHWAEGAAVGVGGAPWPTIFDGVDGWRMSGFVDYEHPERTPDGSVVTRLSAGEGPEPGCC